MKKIIIAIIIPFALACGDETIFTEQIITSTTGDSTAFNVKDFGAKGDGVTDDTQSIQNALDACLKTRGKLLIPAPSNFYKITNTLNIVPIAPDKQAWIHVEGWGHHGFQIVYMGPSNKPAVKIVGLKGGIISGMRVRLGSGVANSQCFDIGTSNDASSTSGFSFINCDAELGNGVNNKGWRLGAIKGGNEDISQILWSNSSAWGPEGSTISGQVGFEMVGSNTLQLTWTGGASTFCEKGISVTAGGSSFFYGYGGAFNGTDFYFATSNQFGIYGGRFESGKKFLEVPSASSHPSVIISNTMISEYKPQDGKLIEFNRTGSLILDGVKIENANNRNHDGKMIWLGGTTGQGNLHVRGGAFHCSADPFFTMETPGMWRINISDVGKLNGSYQSVSYFNNVISVD